MYAETFAKEGKFRKYVAAPRLLTSFETTPIYCYLSVTLRFFFGTIKTLHTFPMLILLIPSCFHAGSSGLNFIDCFFNTPKGTAIIILLA